MKWIPREKVKVDRVACPWLIRNFVDKEAEFYCVPAEHVKAETERLGAIPFDVPSVELGHHGKECSFDAIMKKYVLARDRALVLNALAEGFRHLGYPDDQAIIEAEQIVYDALYAYCKEMIRRGKPHGSYAA